VDVFHSTWGQFNPCGGYNGVFPALFHGEIPGWEWAVGVEVDGHVRFDFGGVLQRLFLQLTIV